MRKTTRQNKHEKSEAGSQRYLCKQCNRTYVTMPKWRRYNEETKKQEIQLYMEGNSSGRAVGRILGVSINICIYWIKKYTKTIKERYPHKRVEVIEMGELYLFIEKKTSNRRL